VSTLVAGVRSAAGHPSGPQTAADTDMAIDTSLATSAGHQPSGGQWFRKQRTVNPPIVPARYNFLYSSSSRPAGGPCGDPSPPVRRQPGRGVVPAFSVYTPYPGAHLIPRLRHATAKPLR
jgi:hypothetical protein